MAEAADLLAEAVTIIEGLADQQAMPDDFYVEPLARFKAFLAPTTVEQEPDGP